MSVDDPFGQHSPTPATAAYVEPVVTSGEDDFEPGDVATTDPTANRVAGVRAVAVVQYVATAFADNPDAVEVEARERSNGSDVSLQIHADRNDVGRLIGRRGRVINAMRQVARAAGAIDGERIQLDIAE